MKTNDIEMHQNYSNMLTEDLVGKMIQAHKLLDRVKFILEQEQYLSLPVEIGNFLKEV